jgi:putative heme-binding domain-containing protein
MEADIRNMLAEKSGSKTTQTFSADSVLAMKGNAAKGITVFKTNCAMCHQVKGEGTDFGPKLSEIGSKLPKDAILESIVNPSGGVSFGYETTELDMKDGSTVKGIVTNKTESEIDIKFPGGSADKVKTANVKRMKKSDESMMPALHQSMSKQDLADLLAYLSSLHKK